MGVQSICGICRGKHRKVNTNGAVEATKTVFALSLRRADGHRSGGFQAFWGMHVEATNFSGMGHAEYAAALGLSPHSLRIWRDRLEQSGNEMDWRSLLHPSVRAQLSSAANCARCKHRLPPQEADGRSNRRRFTDGQKRAMVQETEKPGVAAAEVGRRHGIATSLLFRWRVQFGLTARRRRNWRGARQRHGE